MLKQINDGIFNTKHIVKFYFKNNTNLVISDINNSETTITFKNLLIIQDILWIY